MKTRLRLIPVLLLLITSTLMYAGGPQLWTTMSSGGASNMGVIYNVNGDGSNGTVAVTFTGANGANPAGNLVQGAGSIIYGTTTAGGNYNHGVLFSYDPNKQVYMVLHHFDRIGGCAPKDLLLASDGKLYGTTETGGLYTNTNSPNGLGTLYCYDIAKGVFSKLIDFDGVNGENPQGIMQANNGMLYGLTRLGGDYQRGVLYSYNRGTKLYRKLYSFNGVNGEMPTNCKLIQATDGKLYGMTTWGGEHNMGTMFSFDINCGNYMKGVCNVYTKLYDFNGANGSYPTGTLLQASDGQLYGVTSYGGSNGSGVLFSYNTQTAGYNHLHSFDGATGQSPYSGLIQGSDNQLYGMTTEGGANNLGVIFNYDINTQTYNVVSDCDSSTVGAKPNSNLLEFEVKNNTGIRNAANATATIYPIPAHDRLTIKCSTFKPEVVTIYNVNGVQIMQTPFTENLDVTPLAAGIYFIEVKNATSTARNRISKL